MPEDNAEIRTPWRTVHGTSTGTVIRDRKRTAAVRAPRIREYRKFCRSAATKPRAHNRETTMTQTNTARLFHFVAGAAGPWQIEDARWVCGDPLPAATHISVLPDTPGFHTSAAVWSLRGITSNERYVTSAEKSALAAVQEGLGRAQATRAALIPIRKNAAWWALPQDERRQILEDQSHHIAIGLQYLPAIARRLHHCRDLGGSEPFDFITWFEYAPEHGSAFDELVAALRASVEWQYVEREADFRLIRKME